MSLSLNDLQKSYPELKLAFNKKTVIQKKFSINPVLKQNSLMKPHYIEQLKKFCSKEDFTELPIKQPYKLNDYLMDSDIFRQTRQVQQNNQQENAQQKQTTEQSAGFISDIQSPRKFKHVKMKVCNIFSNGQPKSQEYNYLYRLVKETVTDNFLLTNQQLNQEGTSQQTNPNRLYEHLFEQLRNQRAKKQFLHQKMLNKNSKSVNFQIQFKEQSNFNLALQGSQNILFQSKKKSIPKTIPIPRIIIQKRISNEENPGSGISPLFELYRSQLFIHVDEENKIKFNNQEKKFNKCKFDITLIHQTENDTNFQTKNSIIILTTSLVNSLIQKESANHKLFSLIKIMQEVNILILLQDQLNIQISSLIQTYKNFNLHFDYIFKMKFRSNPLTNLNKFLIDLSPIVKFLNDKIRDLYYLTYINKEDYKYMKYSKPEEIPVDLFLQKIPILFASNQQIKVWYITPDINLSKLINFIVQDSVGSQENKKLGQIQITEIISLIVDQTIRMQEREEFLVKFNQMVKACSKPQDSKSLEEFFQEQKKQTIERVSRSSNEKVGNLHFLVGDLFVRNFSLMERLFKQSTGRLIRIPQIQNIENLNCILSEQLQINIKNVIRLF